MSRPIIEIQNVSKSYRLGQFNASTMREEAERFLQRLRKSNGTATARSDAFEFWALKDVSLSVDAGDVIGIIGRNGAGKSTLLKILSRVTEPTSGEVKIRGRAASLLEVGTGFHPELTGRENVYLNGAILGMTKAEVKAKFAEIVAFAGIGDFLDTPVKRYSSGMSVRLGFAVAAHLEPEVLIVDEVLAVGDAEFQRKCLGKLQDAGRRHGRTVLFVSHNLSLIRALAPKSLLLESGAVRFFGPTPACIDAYLDGDGTSAGGPSIQMAGRHTRVLSVSILDANGRATDRYLSDSALQLDTTIDTDGTRGMSFDVHIVNALGQRVYWYNSTFDGVELPARRGCYRLRTVFPPLHLAAGRYSVDIVTSVTNISFDCHIEAAARFQIPYCNPMGSTWDFKESDGLGMIALKTEIPISIDRIT